MKCVDIQGFFWYTDPIVKSTIRKESIMLKFFTSKHHSIEKFGVMLITLSSLLMLLTSTIVVNKVASDKKEVSTRVMYTTKVAFSHSGVSGDVVSVMSSTDKTKSFILLHMTDMTLLPSDANDYTVFVTGSSLKQKKQKLKSGVSGTLYVFGTTGYYGIYLMNDQPFPNQILNIIIRNNEDVSGMDNATVSATGVGVGGSFKKFDQMQVYVNPGAAGSQVVKFLDASALDMSKMYKEAIIVPQEKTIHAKLNEDLFTMFVQQRLMRNYIDTLTSGQAGIALQEPVTPQYIAGDKLTAKSIDGKTVLDWSTSQNGFVEAGSKEARPKTYNTGTYNLYLNAKDVIPGGFDFNWQERTVDEGWLDELTGGASLDSYFEKVQADVTAATNAGTDRLVLPDTWYYKDGTVFNYTTINPDDKVSTQLATTIKNLQTAWESYYNAKREYETVDLKNLLYLERDSKTIAHTYTQNTNPDSFKTY